MPNDKPGDKPSTPQPKPPEPNSTAQTNTPSPPAGKPAKDKPIIEDREKGYGGSRN